MKQSTSRFSVRGSSGPSTLIAVSTLFVCAALTLTAFGCCSINTSPEDFRRLPLETQIEKWREFRSSRCGTEASAQFLDGIALHGIPAADAMIPFLTTVDPAFPQEDAINVVGLVDAHGANIRGHAATTQIRILLTDSPDAYVRKAAWFALRSIDGVDPPMPK
ncbi:MAG TPA: hypothetical protein VN181_02490 [Thermoanaerobaculia bacterium]|nr:hypothetical protein [Thermoanaerobaculia bacterium]